MLGDLSGRLDAWLLADGIEDEDEDVKRDSTGPDLVVEPTHH